MKSVAIIIPTYNDSVRLTRCLQAIGRQTYPLDKINVYVVDNNSQEDIRTIAGQFHFCHYLKESKPGSYHARNLALSQLNSEKVVGFTDSDCIPRHDWVENAVCQLNKYGSVAIGGRIELFPQIEGKPNLVEQYEIIYGFPQKEYIEKNHFAVTANMFTTCEVIQKNGLFNSSLYSGGDLDWGNRLKNTNIKVIYSDETVVQHPARSSLSQILKKIRRTAGGSYQQRKQTLASAELFSLPFLIKGYVPPVRIITKMPSNGTIITKLNIFFLATYIKFYKNTIRWLYKLRILRSFERM